MEGTFADETHKKAWLIVTASNYCKDMLKHWWNRRKNLDDYRENAGEEGSEADEMMSLILQLPDKYTYAEGFIKVRKAYVLQTLW